MAKTACDPGSGAGMLRGMDAPLPEDVESYYDAAPRPNATTEEIGPFTLFVATDPDAWPYYARPRLGLDRDVDVDDVCAVLDRQSELGVPRSIEWVHETTPSLLPAAREAGLTVHECPLLVLAGDPPTADARFSGRVEVLQADSADLGVVLGAVSAAFHGSDGVEPKAVGRLPVLMERGLTVMVAAYDERGEVVGGGSHNPRGHTTELTGIATAPRARGRGFGQAVTAALVADARARGIDTIFLSARDDAVARIYERVGFVRVGTACIAEMPEGSS